MFQTSRISRSYVNSSTINPLRTMCFEKNWFKPEGSDTGISIYNCAARRQVPLVLTHKSFVTWYTCGPTVYDSSHLGHASCYVKLDILQRILKRHMGLNVVTAMNITDIDDKIIKRSEETNCKWQDISRQYEMQFWSDLRKLNVMEPNIKVRVTDHMPKIVEYIGEIMKKNCAYVGKDSSVYFDVKKFPKYGKLQNLNLEEKATFKAGETMKKSSPLDFALWKAQKSTNEPAWPSPWGPGRPGWHIECSALVNMIFGKTVDIHAGGLDLKFPHHENEEAQSCVYHDSQQWVNYWLHTGHLSVKGQKEKMSKSLKNTISIEEMLSSYTADEFRMACAMSNYKNSMEYSSELMDTARNTLNKFHDFKVNCRAYMEGKLLGSNMEASVVLQNLTYCQSQIQSSIRDDFDTARCLTLLIDLISGTNRGIIGNANTNFVNGSCLDAVASVYNYVDYVMQTFGFTFAEEFKSHLPNEINDDHLDLNALLDDILMTRKVIRERAVKDKTKALFEVCDDIRKCLRQHGIEIKDHGQGSTWNYISKKN